MAQSLYPLHNLPSSWIDLVQFLEAYTPRIEYKMVYWKTPSRGYKCNTDGAAKGNPGPSSGVSCVRNEAGNLMYAEGRRFGENSNIVAKFLAFKMGLEYCINHRYLPLTMETDSLAIKNILDGGWDTTWCITIDITKIKSLLVESNTTVEYTYREGNKLADFFANHVFYFAEFSNGYPNRKSIIGAKGKFSHANRYEARYTYSIRLTGTYEVSSSSQKGFKSSSSAVRHGCSAR
ncbi:hypothetical protein KY289_001250 [Solanum tuberosum]|nr:hypothetical protein KY289_001250 [Solanum tuberosum]